MIYTAISFIVSLAVTFVCMPLLLRLCKLRGLYDMPNERKIHHNKIPRLGGVVFAPAMIIGLVTAFIAMLLMGDRLPTFGNTSFFISAGFFLIYLIGLLDDLLGLNASVKFLVQLASALFLPFCGVCLNNLYGLFGIHEVPLWAGVPLTALISLLVINAINLIDGIDGLSSSLSLIALVAFTVMFLKIGFEAYAMLAAGLCGTVLAFLYFNMLGRVERNTKTFMGDTGSLILGYALAFFAIKYAMYAPMHPYRGNALLVSYTLLIVPTFDLIRVAICRLRHGVSIFHADKTHIHHKFMAMGWSMRKSLAAILCLQLLFIVFNFSCVHLCIPAIGVVLSDILIFAAVQWLLDSRIARKHEGNGNV